VDIQKSQSYYIRFQRRRPDHRGTETILQSEAP